ncbi:ATP-binding protein [Goodfellowiella coeruleoviolacea]|uniref:Anti-sigma regulatory factor (Ser/Thr protein kinase) n=1 Tax=Goodfellowiella coeruleoviolacea TaxID=334858 RepID=A0AAE3KED7_9PSEU|nr:ATP-binding protein [Goodfellowiella coeruleoviolacea]MCP2163745.1 Anti-sigma regulatory factor (Ser/Thr protein kinase) [Goodfellowiella coeruleoviolacea]
MTPPEPLELELPAEPVALRELRARLGGWLRTVGVADQAGRDLVLAMNEAATNAVEHAYAGAGTGVVRLRAALCADRWIQVDVIDHGHWRQPSGGLPDRGRGMLIMRGCVDDLGVSGTSSGTTVTLRVGPDALAPAPT